ncbi:MAG TPA: sigma-70 family RNA polymerase sigma factor [Ktedonobacterales bacterium]|nr:sigma-70 family RNA polymerase sigma factor [Ktedonobacterales bacterium]
MQQNTPAQTEVAPASLGLRALYEATLPSVYRYIYSKVGNREEAEDLTSQVYLKALRGLDEARDPNAAQAWLFQVARTTIADYWRVFYRLRSSSLDDLLAAGWDSPTASGELAADHGSGDRAQHILSQLPERYREVLTYRFLMNCSLKETAARMNLTEANVKVLQFRALKKASRAVERDVETDESC